MVRIALVVPEYRTESGVGGGITTMADSILKDLAFVPDWSTDVISLRMSRRAPQSVRLLAPHSWFKGPRLEERRYGTTRIIDVGSHLAEFETFRYLPRRSLDRLLGQYDIALVLSGSPAPAVAIRRMRMPIVSYPATLISEERQSLLSSAKGLRRVFMGLNTWITGRLDEAGLRLADSVLVINPWMLEECQRRGLSDAILAPPGIDTDFFTPAERTQRDGYILTVGRLADPRKRIGDLIRAYKVARELDPNVPRLVLAGREKPAEADLRLIVDLQLIDHVDVLAPVAPENLAAIYQGASIFVLPSSEEGLGIVLLEAMACGLPVISTDTEGGKYVISAPPIGGRLVSLGPGVESRLGEMLVQLSQDEHLRSSLGIEGRERVLSTFSQQAAAERLRSTIHKSLLPTLH
ncbi:glycosyltransferase family 4 protein [Cryobacterium sp. TMT4-10]|uniref:glycosyltransferase family 4 protein n=1 Tax=Cryobacterium sp. TMT4-10 TaxID=1259256 RepID=UPI00141AF7D2|nr:glycosyltransferase family 4 protein [Cryobacterium sp. TMT4-10]